MITQTTAFYDTIDAAGGRNRIASAQTVAAFVRAEVPGARTMLEIGCGTGAHLATFATANFSARGIEADLKAVALARSRTPEIVVDPAELTTFELGERFDAIVSLDGSSAFARLPARLDALLARIAQHLEPTGIVVIEPYAVAAAAYRPGTLESIFVDEPDLKIARMCLSKQMGKIGILDYHYLVASLRGVERFFERHEIGLFTDAVYEAAFASASLSFDRMSLGVGRDAYVGRPR